MNYHTAALNLHKKDLKELESDFGVDVVDLASVSRALRRFIEQEGVVLYEKRGDAQNSRFRNP
jgi:hypothetical protein